MYKLCILVWTLLLTTIFSSYGFWVINKAPVDSLGQTSDINQNATWVDLPQNISVSAPRTSQISDVNSDIEYESRSYRIPGYKSRGDIVKISGQYEYFPDDTKSYGFRFYNEHLDGLDYSSVFNIAGTYKKYFQNNWEAGCNLNLSFMSGDITGAGSGIIIGPTFHGLYKYYIGASRVVGGAFVGYSYCGLIAFNDAHRNFFNYGFIANGSTPINDKLSSSIDFYLSTKYLASSLQLPYNVSSSMQLILGVKKLFIFSSTGLSSWSLTLGACKRF